MLIQGTKGMDQAERSVALRVVHPAARARSARKTKANDGGESSSREIEQGRKRRKKDYVGFIDGAGRFVEVDYTIRRTRHVLRHTIELIRTIIPKFSFKSS